MDERIVDVVVLAIGLPLFGVGVYLWAQAVRHMIGTLTNFKPNMSWGKLLPFCVLMPVFFNEKGNEHREKLLKYGGLFVAYCSLPVLVLGIWKLFAN